MEGNKKIAINSIIIFTRLIVTSVIGVLMSRLILDALGVSDYGLYNVVGGIVILLNIFNTAMVATTYRFVAVELGKEEKGDTNKVFNACFIIHCVFSVLIVILGLTFGEWYLSNGLNVSMQKLADAKLLFRLSILTTVLSVLMVPYNGLLVAYEKFHIQAAIDVIVAIGRYILLLIIIHKLNNRLLGYGIINVIFSIANYSAALFYCRIVFKKVVSFQFITDSKLYREMIKFAGWILLGASASIGKTQGSVMIINYFFGTAVNGAYAIAHQVESFISMFSQSLNKAAVPQIMKSFSGGNVERSVLLTSYISKYTFILMSMVAFPVLMEMDFLLSIWLKDVPEGTTVFCKLMTVSILLGSLGEGIPALIQATNKQKLFQIIGSVLTLSGLPISYLLFCWEYPAQTILIVYCIILAIYSIVRLFLLKRVMDFNIKEFVRTSYLRIFLISIPLIIAYCYYYPDNFSLAEHVAGLIFSEIFLVIIVLLLGLDKREYAFVKNFCNKKSSK